MKKTTIIIISVVAGILAVLVGVIVVLGITKASSSSSNGGTLPYIYNVSENWKSNYFVGEELDLDGLKIQYYPNIEKEDEFQTINVTSEMVSGFSTAKVGSYQLNVNYKGAQETVKYEVFEMVNYDLNKTFNIANNVLATIDTTQKKVDIVTYANLQDLLKQENGTSVKKDIKIKLETMDYENLLNSVYAEFENENVTYQIHWQKEDSYALCVIRKNGNSYNRTKSSIKVFSAESVVVPQESTVYKSKVSNNSLAYAVFGANGSVNIYITDNESLTDFTQETPFVVLTNADMGLNVGRIVYTKTLSDGKIQVTYKNPNVDVVLTNADGTFNKGYSCALQS